jgi:membrane fusion protein, multidrug efflux system
MPARVCSSVAVVATLSLSMLSGCNDRDQQSAAAPPPPPAVTVVKVEATELRPSLTFTGRIEAVDKVDLRARVEGFLEKRHFTEGADVKAGELLFVIEQAPYRASVEEARSATEKAEAALKLADIEVDRQQELVRRDAGTRARLDQVAAQQAQGRGELSGSKATLEKAELQLGYTEIRAPLAGRIGRSAISVGNFVGPSSGVLATIVSQDPIYASFPVSQREILAVRRQLGSDANPADADVTLQLADGSRYPHKGKIDFLDVTVNKGTDTVQARARFPNPDRHLVDGQLVTVIVEGGRPRPSLVIPQASMQIDQSGPFVLAVGKDSKIEVRRIEPGPVEGASVNVLKGLAAGDLIVTEGIQRVRPGQVVQAAEAGSGT